MELAKDSSRPHVIIIPYLSQGHVTPMLHLAELLCLGNLNVTFLSTPHIHKALTKTGSLEGRFSRFEEFRFQAVPDGLPDDHPRTGEDGTWAMSQGFASNAKPILKEISVGPSAITWLILDGWLTSIDAAAKEANIPVIAFRCFSAAAESAYSYASHLFQKQLIPLKDEDMDCLVKDAPGMDNFLRYRDLPSFCRIKDKLTCQQFEVVLYAEVQKVQQAHGLILNTFEDLEGPILSLLRSKCSKVYSIGPLHAHVEQRRKVTSATMYNNGSSSSSSFFEEDSSCLSWLDQKPDKSVVYVSFGSSTIIERKQFLEIWSGLVQSDEYFLWVIKSDFVNPGDTDSPTPSELLVATEERGCIVSWSPQEAVLTHRAIGGFLTHSGWNSTLESIVAGVPMICWPYFCDQLVNSRYVSEVWRIGLDMKDTCDRNVVEKMIHDLLDGRKQEFQGHIANMSDLAKKSTSEGGSSYNNLDCLIHDIRMMSVKAR